MEESHAALLQRIEAAFANVPRPTKVTKRVAREFDDEPIVTEQRRASLYAKDTEQHGKDLSGEDLATYQDVCLWLDEEASLFYFPAFMFHNLIDEQPFGWCSADNIAWIYCTRPEQLRLFNDEQLRCVTDFVALRTAHENGASLVCPVCGGPLISEKCKVVCRSERCRYRIVFNCAEF